MKPIFKILSILVLILALCSCERGEQGASSNTTSISSTASSITESARAEENSSKIKQEISSKETVSKEAQENSSKGHSHEWGKWIHDKFPNNETGELGSSHRTCKICKAVETKELTFEEVHHMFTTDGLIYLQ